MTRRTLLLVTLLLPACGDDAGRPDSGPAGDAAPTADGTPAPDAEPGTATVFAVGTDFFTAGIASTVAVPSLELTQGAVAGVASTDPVVRRFGDRLYIINRYGADNVTILEAHTLALVAQISTGSGSNPWDVAVYGDRIYVAALAAGGLLVLDSTRPDDGVIDRIDMPAVDLADGNPNCNALAIADDRLYAVCGVLDDDDPWLTPRGPGRIVSIDLADDSVDRVMQLTHANPQGQLMVTPTDGPLGGDLLIDTVSYADLTAQCLERVGRGVAPQIKGCLIEHADLGGIATGAAWTPDHHLHIAVTLGWDSTDYQPLGKVITYDATTGELAADAMTPSDQRPFDLALCPTGHLALADAGGGLRIYDPTGTEMTTAVIDLGLPPVSGGTACF